MPHPKKQAQIQLTFVVQQKSCNNDTEKWTADALKGLAACPRVSLCSTVTKDCASAGANAKPTA
jgi:hypothetical protein